MSRNADKMNRDRNRALNTLNKINETLIIDLVRRASTRATIEKNDSGPKGKGGISDPTLSAVMRSMTKAKVSDPVYDSVKDIATSLNDIAEICLRIDEKVRYITTVRESAKEAQIIYCLACNREILGTPADRPRSGMCLRDYQRWQRAGRPYRDAFFAQVKAEETQEN